MTEKLRDKVIPITRYVIYELFSNSTSYLSFLLNNKILLIKIYKSETGG